MLMSDRASSCGSSSTRSSLDSPLANGAAAFQQRRRCCEAIDLGPEEDGAGLAALTSARSSRPSTATANHDELVDKVHLERSQKEKAEEGLQCALGEKDVLQRALRERTDQQKRAERDARIQTVIYRHRHERQQATCDELARRLAEVSRQVKLALPPRQVPQAPPPNERPTTPGGTQIVPPEEAFEQLRNKLIQVLSAGGSTQWTPRPVQNSPSRPSSAQAAGGPPVPPPLPTLEGSLLSKLVSAQQETTQQQQQQQQQQTPLEDSSSTTTAAASSSSSSSSKISLKLQLQQPPSQGQQSQVLILEAQPISEDDGEASLTGPVWKSVPSAGSSRKVEEPAEAERDRPLDAAAAEGSYSSPLETIAEEEHQAARHRPQETSNMDEEARKIDTPAEASADSSEQPSAGVGVVDEVVAAVGKEAATAVVDYNDVVVDGDDDVATAALHDDAAVAAAVGVDGSEDEEGVNKNAADAAVETVEVEVEMQKESSEEEDATCAAAVTATLTATTAASGSSSSSSSSSPPSEEASSVEATTTTTATSAAATATQTTCEAEAGAVATSARREAQEVVTAAAEASASAAPEASPPANPSSEEPENRPVSAASSAGSVEGYWGFWREPSEAGSEDEKKDAEDKSARSLSEDSDEDSDSEEDSDDDSDSESDSGSDEEEDEEEAFDPASSRSSLRNLPVKAKILPANLSRGASKDSSQSSQQHLLQIGSRQASPALSEGTADWAATVLRRKKRDVSSKDSSSSSQGHGHGGKRGGCALARSALRPALQAALKVPEAQLVRQLRELQQPLLEQQVFEEARLEKGHLADRRHTTLAPPDCSSKGLEEQQPQQQQKQLQQQQQQQQLQQQQQQQQLEQETLKLSALLSEERQQGPVQREALLQQQHHDSKYGAGEGEEQQQQQQYQEGNSPKASAASELAAFNTSGRLSSSSNSSSSSHSAGAAGDPPRLGLRKPPRKLGRYASDGCLAKPFQKAGPPPSVPMPRPQPPDRPLDSLRSKAIEVRSRINEDQLQPPSTGTSQGSASRAAQQLTPLHQPAANNMNMSNVVGTGNGVNMTSMLSDVSNFSGGAPQDRHWQPSPPSSVGSRSLSQAKLSSYRTHDAWEYERIHFPGRTMKNAPASAGKSRGLKLSIVGQSDVKVAPLGDVYGGRPLVERTSTLTKVQSLPSIGSSRDSNSLRNEAQAVRYHQLGSRFMVS